jgi:hypothetical protein
MEEKSFKIITIKTLPQLRKKLIQLCRRYEHSISGEALINIPEAASYTRDSKGSPVPVTGIVVSISKVRRYGIIHRNNATLKKYLEMLTEEHFFNGFIGFDGWFLSPERVVDNYRYHCSQRNAAIFKYVCISLIAPILVSFLLYYWQVRPTFLDHERRINELKRQLEQANSKPTMVISTQPSGAPATSPTK